MCALVFQFEHGTIIPTRITCKKIPCYMRDSTCKWLIVKKLKYFEVMLNMFKLLRVWENVESWLVYSNKLLWIAQSYFSTDIINKFKASFFILLLRLLMKKIKFLIKCYCFNRYNSLYFNKTKKIKLFYLHCYCGTSLSNQFRRI